MMSDTVWLALALGVCACLAYRAWRIWLDASRHSFSLARRFGWACLGAILPSRYWWRARIAALTPLERTNLLARERVAGTEPRR